MRKKRFKSEILKITKTSKVLKGGKLIRFRIFLVTGNKKNKIGFGIGKDSNFENAYKKAIKNSYLNIFKISKFNTFKFYKTLPKLIKVKVKKTIIIFKPKYKNTGIHANALIYTILKLAGVKHASVKLIGSKNSLNSIYAVIKALKTLSIEKKIKN